jgi:lipopolysaccharide transport system ATP-binding protein
MSSNIAIKVENLSKCYQIYQHPSDRLKQFILPRLQRAAGLPAKLYHREFWALKDVSFEVEKGETIGIIGRNGSGKSTLLQMICGTLAPASGRIKTHGRISALLELGSGFNPDFTGRENVYMNASILGLLKDEIDARFQEIAAFADIGEFIERPVKTYSSGMMVRLAFAVQAQVDPDILIVDEALAVGDAKFQARCFDRLKQLKAGGTSILLVTHSTEQIVTHCSRALLLDHGNLIATGDPNCVVNSYLDLLFGKTKNQIDEPKKEVSQRLMQSPTPHLLDFDEDAFSTRPGYNVLEYRWGDCAAKITDFYLESEGQAYPTSIKSGEKITLNVGVKFFDSLIRPIFGITIKTKEGVSVYGANTETLDVEAFKSKGTSGQTVVVKIEFMCRLAAGDYFISLGVATHQGHEITPHDRRYDSVHFQVRPVTTFFGLVDTDLNISVEEFA